MTSDATLWGTYSACSLTPSGPGPSWGDFFFLILGSLYSRTPGGSILAWDMGKYWSGQVGFGLQGFPGRGHGLSKPHFMVTECSSWELWEERSPGLASS